VSIPGERLARFCSLVIDQMRVLSGVYVLSPQAAAELEVNQGINSLETEFIPELCLNWTRTPPPGCETGQLWLFFIPPDVLMFHIVDYEILYVVPDDNL
jgi:hypothetical protein